MDLFDVAAVQILGLCWMLYLEKKKHEVFVSTQVSVHILPTFSCYCLFYWINI